jgi:iron uptake system component EfeO
VRALTVLVAALAAASVAACGKDDDKGGRKVMVELTDAGCSPLKLRIPAGPTTFEATNKGTDKATEFEVLQRDRVLGEKENLTEGLSGSFSLDLDAGRYQIWCGPGTPKGVLEVTGQASNATANPKLAAAVRGDRYVRAQVADLPLNEYIKHTSSALFAVPPGVRGRSDWVGRALLA